jgi:uncharacterized membrane protein
MIALLFLGFVVLAVVVMDVRSRVSRQDRLIQTLMNRITALEFAKQEKPAEARGKAPARRVALVQPTPQILSPPIVEATPPPAPEPTAPPPAPLPQRSGPARIISDQSAPPSATARDEAEAQAQPEAPAFTLPKINIPKISISFETFFGAKLPIWIGGIALILSAFFLVRYSIDKGLLGPGIRSIMATLFGVTLLVASEAARRIPRFADDPRVGQALAGAGIASLYGTLYMASELYQLISPLSAFTAMVAVTIAALILSLRHGAPTAIMGLIGGFTAPFMAAPSGNLVPLFIYLGLLIAGLFAVAIHRGWRWLAVAATGGGLTWSLGIMATNAAGIGPSLGMFVVAVAIGSTMLFPKSGLNNARIRVLPMVAGFVQLAIFAPIIQFGLSGWLLYGLLSAASLYLCWREPKLTPASLAALGLVIILLYAAFDQGRDLAIWAAIGATILFAVPGHLLARRPATDTHWTFLALGGTAAPLFTAYLAGHNLLSETMWGDLFGIAAIPLAWLSWRARSDGHETGRPDWALFGGGVLAGTLISIAALNWFDPLLLGGALLTVALGLAYWAKHTLDRMLFNASLGFTGVGLILWAASFALHPEMFDAIMLNGLIPPTDQMIALLAVPTTLVGALSWCHRDRFSDHPLRWIALGFAISIPLALAPTLWHTIVMLGAAALLGGWARRSGDEFRYRASLAALVVAAGFWLFEVIRHLDLPWAIFGDGPVPEHTPLIALIGLPAALLGATAWGHQSRFADQPLRWQSLGLLLAVLTALVPYDWHPVTLISAAALAAFAGSRLPLPKFGLEGMFGVAGVVLAIRLLPFIGIMIMSVIGGRTHFDQLPALSVLLISVTLPAVIASGAAWAFQNRITGHFGGVVRGMIGLASVATLYTIAKQPFAIATDAQFIANGFIERAAITQTLFAIGAGLLWRGGDKVRLASFAILGFASLRFIGFDLVQLNPLLVTQQVGTWPVMNAASLHFGLAALWCWIVAGRMTAHWAGRTLRLAALPMTAIALGMTVRQVFQGSTLDSFDLSIAENFSYSAAFLALAILWLWRGMVGGVGWLRVTGLALLTVVTFKVFLIDASVLEGLLRALSFLGLGVSLIGIGWAYPRLMGKTKDEGVKAG